MALLMLLEAATLLSDTLAANIQPQEAVPEQMALLGLEAAQAVALGQGHRAVPHLMAGTATVEQVQFLVCQQHLGRLGR